MIFDRENWLWKSDFGTFDISLRGQFTKLDICLLVCWFLVKDVTHLWRFNNRRILPFVYLQTYFLNFDRQMCFGDFLRSAYTHTYLLNLNMLISIQIFVQNDIFLGFFPINIPTDKVSFLQTLPFMYRDLTIILIKYQYTYQVSVYW